MLLKTEKLISGAIGDEKPTEWRHGTQPISTSRGREGLR
jgi:hypothetical protein